jgi:hypothetical protein
VPTLFEGERPADDPQRLLDSSKFWTSFVRQVIPVAVIVVLLDQDIAIVVLCV